MKPLSIPSNKETSIVSEAKIINSLLFQEIKSVLFIHDENRICNDYFNVLIFKCAEKCKAMKNMSYERRINTMLKGKKPGAVSIHAATVNEGEGRKKSVK